MGAPGSERGAKGPGATLTALARFEPGGWGPRILIGLGFALAAVLIRWTASAWYGETAGLMILLPGVVLAAVVGGRVAALVAVPTTLLLGWAVAGPDAVGVGIDTHMGRVATLNFVIVGLFCTWVAASLRDAVAGQSRTDALLDEGERRFRDIADVAPVMLWSADALGRLYVNAEFRRFWGDRAMDGADMAAWIAAIHPDDRDRVVAASTRALTRREPLEIEARYLRHDGQWRMLRTFCRPRSGPDSGFLGMVGANVDVTDARADAVALAESRARFELVADSIPNLAWMAEPDGAIYWYNRRWYEFTGTTPQQMQGWGWRSVHDPAMVEGVTERFKASVADGTPWEDLFPLRRHDGEWRWFLSRAAPVRDEQGQIVRWFGTNTDVTQQREAEARLRESEERFRLMADTAPSPVWMTNAEAEVEFVNQALVEFYGHPAETFLGHVWKQSVHPQDQQIVADAQAEARPLRRPYDFEVRFRRRDDAWRWMRVAVKPRFDGDGAFLGYVGMSFDVTETREALDALADLERRQSLLLALSDRLRDLAEPEAVMHEAARALADALDAQRVGYGEIDETGERIAVRRPWAREGSHDPEGLWPLNGIGEAGASALREGRTVRLLDPAEHVENPESSETWRRSGGRAVMAAPVFRGGSLRAVLYAVRSESRAWTDPEAGLIEDVAARAFAEVERTRAEAAVRESEQRFRAVADTAPVLIWVTDAQRVRSFVNQAYVAFNGGTYEDARLADWRAVLHPDDQARIVSESVAGEATGKPFSLEARFRRHDGAWRWLKSFSRPRLGGDGQVIGFVGVAFDVSDAKQAQVDLKRMNELLEERVGEALAEKAKAEADLMHAQRMEAVGRLTGGVAHDFNNLLTVVIGGLDMMLQAPDDAKRQKRLGEAALAAARRGERLTHQLLAFSRRQTLRPEPTDLNALIVEGELLLRRAVGEAVTLDLRLAERPTWVDVDAAQFEAALLNLLVNARDAVSEGGRVVIETRVRRLRAGQVAEVGAGDHVCVAVIDDGAGIDPAVLPRIFEPFFTTKSVGKGTGLGLSQVYGFSRQSGGGLSVESAPGKGTRISMFLPALKHGPRAVAAATDRAPVGRPGRRLLLVEDDAAVAAVAAEMVESLGFSVRTADHAAAALALLEVETFDVMLTDVVMPGGISGVDLARRTAERHPDMAVVLASGYAGDDVERTVGDAPWPFVKKPYSRESLAEVLTAEAV